MKTKKLLSVLLAITMVIGMMTTITISASAKPATDHFINVGETQVIRAEGIYSSETTDGNYYYLSVVDGSTQSVPMNNISIESVEQDGNEMVITIKGVAVTDEELVDIVAKVYREDESDWVDVAIQCAYHVVLPDDAEYLDLDENTTEILDNKQLDQNYNLAVNEGTKTDVTKVKLSWEIKDINATRTDNKVWDTENLCWKTDSSSTTINQQGKAKFTLENYSSVKVDATATFKAEGSFKGTASYDVEGGKVTLDTANGNSTYSKTNVPTKVINATITTATDDFKTANATTKATKYGTYTVTISKYVATESIVLSNDTLDLNTNTNITATLTATVSPVNATDNKVTWYSDNTAVATVDENGKVTAVGAGTATITATVGAKSTTCTVNVVAKIPVTNVSLNKTELTLTSNDYSNKTATLIATVTPDNATNKNVTWSSSNTAVATVDANGNVTAVDYAKGTAIITATADNVYTTCTVTVNCLPE